MSKDKNQKPSNLSPGQFIALQHYLAGFSQHKSFSETIADFLSDEDICARAFCEDIDRKILSDEIKELASSIDMAIFININKL